MSEKIGLARAEIVDLLSLILRTHSRDELFALFRSAEGITPKEDPEAWREENRKKQAAGVKFEKLWYDGKWHTGVCSFTGNKEDYREVQEAPKVKKIGVGIPEAVRKILMEWCKNGLIFHVMGQRVDFEIQFTDAKIKNYTIPEQPIPEGMSVETVETMWRQGLMLEFDGNFGWDLAADGFDWNGIYRGAQLLARLRIPAQPIPEKLLEVPQEVSGAEYARAEPHAVERALWNKQREAGTNEVWQEFYPKGTIFTLSNHEPDWRPDCEYRVKPMKLTAKICRVGKVYPMSYRGQDWEFTGTREEYRAECEKYGYVVISEIKEVKPKMVKYYIALIRYHGMNLCGHSSCLNETKEDFINRCKRFNYTIIGNIETREVEIE